MRKIVLAGLAAGGLVLLSAPPADAYGIRHPFCIQGDAYPALSNCSYDTYDACLATASGRNLSCIANPFFVGESDDPRATPNVDPSPPPSRRGARPPGSQQSY